MRNKVLGDRWVFGGLIGLIPCYEYPEAWKSIICIISTVQRNGNDVFGLAYLHA